MERNYLAENPQKDIEFGCKISLAERPGVFLLLPSHERLDLYSAEVIFLSGPNKRYLKIFRPFS